MRPTDAAPAGAPGSRPTRAPLTEGSVPRVLVRLALPFLLTHALALASVVVNRLWVGTLGSKAMAAIGVASAVQIVLVTFAMGMAVGTLSGVARNVGAGQPAEAARFLAHGLYIAVGTGLLLFAASFVAPAWLLSTMKAEPDVAALASHYLTVSIAGLLVHAPLIVCSFALQGAGEARLALILGGLSALLNAALDPLFMFAFDLGLPGAAWATIVSQVTALVVAAWALSRRDARLRLTAAAARPSARIAWRIVAVGVPGSVEQLVRTIAGFLLVGILTPFGADVVAAYTIGVTLQLILIAPGLALGQATASLVGQNLGARKPRRAWTTTWTGIGLYVAFMTVAGGVLALAAPQLVAAFDHNPRVVEEGVRMLRIVVLCFPFVAVAMVLSRAFGGAGSTWPAMVAAATAHLAIQIPLARELSGRYGPLGAFWAICAAFLVHGVLSAAFFAVRYRGWRTVTA